MIIRDDECATCGAPMRVIRRETRFTVYGLTMEAIGDGHCPNCGYCIDIDNDGVVDMVHKALDVAMSGAMPDSVRFVETDAGWMMV